MNKFCCMIFVFAIFISLQPLKNVEANHYKRGLFAKKVSMLEKWKFIRFLQQFPINTMIPEDNWTSKDHFLDNNAEDLKPTFQVRRFNIGAKMARLNGDIPPLSSYYIYYDQGSSSGHKTTNLLG